jgi:hypothetical protein
VAPYEEKPFRSEDESKEPMEVHVRIGHPRVRPHVVPISGKTGELTKGDFVTSFLVAWQPSPTSPAHWIELLREAPFGTRSIRARDPPLGRPLLVDRAPERVRHRSLRCRDAGLRTFGG